MVFVVIYQLKPKMKLNFFFSRADYQVVHYCKKVETEPWIHKSTEYCLFCSQNKYGNLFPPNHCKSTSNKKWINRGKRSTTTIYERQGSKNIQKGQRCSGKITYHRKSPDSAQLNCILFYLEQQSLERNSCMKLLDRIS